MTQQWFTVVTDEAERFEVALIAPGVRAYATRAEADAVAVELRSAREDRAAQAVANRSGRPSAFRPDENP